VSGNVSLYNETEGRPILPTPAIGGLGVLEDAAQAVGYALPANHDLVVVGATEGWLGQSLWLREIAGREEGAPPPVDLVAERRNGDFVRAEILAGRAAACHDVADGGLLVAIAEMAMAGDTGATLEGPADAAFWYGEDQGRYVLAVTDAPALLARAAAAGVPAQRIGRGTGAALALPEGTSIPVAELRTLNEAFFPNWMD
jgi:phosphoribosylformylglycinamidine synthase